MSAVCAAALAAILATSASTFAAPTWYTNGTGGNNPNVPDFYQHQDWDNSGGTTNGWEQDGGWCFWTAYADVFYDLTQQGYTKLYATTPNAGNWINAMYGSSAGSAAKSTEVTASNLSKLSSAMPNSSRVQAYLDSTANTAIASGGSLMSNQYKVTGGTVSYTLPTGGTATAMGVASLTNLLLKDNAEVLYRLNQGKATLAKSDSGGVPQGLWWNFHYVAVAGISVASPVDNSKVLIADPDTNLGSGTSAAGWPEGSYATSAGFPFSSPAGAPLPVVANASPLTKNFAQFSFSVVGGSASVSSTDSPQYNGTVVQRVESVFVGKVTSSTTGAGVNPSDTKTDLKLALPSGIAAVDKIIVEPSSATDNPSSFATDFSFKDNSDPSATWTPTMDTSDPFGNPLPDNAAEYDLSNGSAFQGGETADLNLGTAGAFTSGGYDILLHFQGDPANVWLPEMIGGTKFDPSAIAELQTNVAVPEPSSAALLVALGLLTAAVSRLRRRISVVAAAAIAACLATCGAALAAPTWYTNGTGGNNPNVPDFYQHQDWNNGGNGWEFSGSSRAGWCLWTSYADVFYDLTQMGYPNLYTAGGTAPTATNWLTAMYGTSGGSAATSAQVTSSNISRVVNSMTGSVQSYLDSTANASAAVTGGSLGRLVSASYTMSGGTATYTPPTGGTASMNLGVASLTNYLIKDLNGEVLYRLNPGTIPVQYASSSGTDANRAQGRWWASFHYVAVAGISVASPLDNSTALIADPDTNKGSGTAAAGWPLGTSAGSFPFSSVAGDPLPVVGNASPLTNNFARFTFSVSGGAARVTSTDSPQYTGGVVQRVEVVYPVAITKSTTGAGLSSGDTRTDLALKLPSGSNPVDKILVEPSTPTDNPVGFAGDFSFVDNSDPSAMWTPVRDAADPFGNALTNGAAEYDLSSGSAFQSGESADLNIGTSGAFAAGGYDVLLHFQGDPANVWLPEMIGGANFNPSDTAEIQTDVVVPEPSAAALLAGSVLAVGLFRLRRSAMHSARRVCVPTV